MNSPHSSVVENENILEQALRTYQQSERSLKSICNSVEQENIQLEDQFKNLQIHQTKLIQQYHFIKQNIQQIREEHHTLTQRQLIIDQQTKIIYQRYEQVQLALKKVLSSAISTNEQFSQQTFSILGFQFIPIDQEKPLTNHIGTNYSPTSLPNKRKLIATEFNQINNSSSLKRSSK